MKKTTMAFLSVILVMTMFLAACGGNSGNGGNSGGAATDKPKDTVKPAETKAPNADPVKLRVFSTFGGTDAAREAFQAALDEFTTANPHVTIDNDTMSADDDAFRTKVNTDMTSGNEPDLLFYFIGADAEGFVNAGKVVPMNDILDADPEWKNGIIPSALEFVRQADGNIYGVPLTGFYEGLFVNKALFEEHGVELPTDWEKMKAAVSAFAAKGVIPLSAPFDQSHYLIEHFVLAAAGPDGQKKGLLDGVDPNWERGLAAMKELYDLGAFPKDAATIDLGMASNYYSEGLAAMLLEGSWAIGNFKDDTKASTTVIPFPAITGGNGSGADIVGGFGSGFYMSKATYDNAAKKDITIELLKHMTSPDTIQKIASANGGTPAAEVELTGLAQVALDGFAMAAKSKSISGPIDGFVSPETFTTIRATIQPVVTGTKTPAQALEEARNIEIQNKK